MPRTGAPPMIGETPTIGAAVATSACADAGDRQDRPDAHDRVGRRQQHHVGGGIASTTPGAGVATSAPTAMISTAGVLACNRTHHSWKWMAGDPRCPSTTHVRLDPVVGHRQQPDAGPPPVAQPGGDLRQRHARCQPLGAQQCASRCRGHRGRTIADARRKRPIRPLLQRFFGPAPTLLLVDAAPRVYMTVSRSGHTRSPNRVMSSPVLPMTVISRRALRRAARRAGRARIGRRRCRRPRRRHVVRPSGLVLRSCCEASHSGLAGRRSGRPWSGALSPNITVRLD